MRPNVAWTRSLRPSAAPAGVLSGANPALGPSPAPEPPSILRGHAPASLRSAPAPRRLRRSSDTPTTATAGITSVTASSSTGATTSDSTSSEPTPTTSDGSATAASEATTDATTGESSEGDATGTSTTTGTSEPASGTAATDTSGDTAASDATTGEETSTTTGETSDGTTAEPCPIGQDGCPCGQSDVCDPGLECQAGLCGPPAPPVCGDGDVEGGEQCDDGNKIPGDGCENDCTPTPMPANDPCGFPSDGVWLEIDYGSAFTSTNPDWTYSPPRAGARPTGRRRASRGRRCGTSIRTSRSRTTRSAG
ncbi:DUF4215 domain-containing protein [Nannocystis pusilla]|uniref:DUF4215 domain-containing protein n=1 Tax=Nannocystis pusilla TaxID=889268 RepID=UPI003B7D1410